MLVGPFFLPSYTNIRSGGDMQVTVRNGTGAGWRVVREKPKDWKCPECKRKLRYYWSVCPTDGTRRPD
jgi:hypothetical protein